MNKFVLAEMINRSGIVDKVEFIEEKCKGKQVLDLGCVRHSAEFALNDPNWIHNKIKAVAEKVLGVDYLKEDVEKLKAKGFNIVWGDVTKPLDINEKYDVIVAGDLIEHLTNFEGLFENLKKLLKKDGIVIITTPNPFFSGLFHFVAFKKVVVINPEHTCWIDPQALSQLSSRFGFDITELNFLKGSWQLANLICESKYNYYDILKGDWVKKGFPLLLIIAISKIFNIIYYPYKMLTFSNSHTTRHSDYVAVLKLIV